jgi:hypothetical protein
MNNGNGNGNGKPIRLMSRENVDKTRYSLVLTDGKVSDATYLPKEKVEEGVRYSIKLTGDQRKSIALGHSIHYDTDEGRLVVQAPDHGKPTELEKLKDKTNIYLNSDDMRPRGTFRVGEFEIEAV